MKQPTTQFIWFLLPHRSLPKHGRRHPNFDIISVMARKQARNYITEIIIKTSYKLVTLGEINFLTLLLTIATL